MSLSNWDDENYNRQVIPKHSDMEKDEKSPSGPDKEEEDVSTVMIGRCATAAESLSPMIVQEMEEIYLILGFSQMVAQN